MKNSWKFSVGILLSLVGLLVWQQLHQTPPQRHGLKTNPKDFHRFSSSTSQGRAESSSVSEEIPRADVFSDFITWKNRKPEAWARQHEWLQEGIRIAARRGALLADLARRQPERALSRLMPLSELADLPEVVRELCEQPVSGIGSIDLQWLTEKNDDGGISCSHRSIAYLGDRSFRVNGRRYLEARAPRKDIPIDGHLIAGELLVNNHNVRRLSSADLAAASRLWPIGNPDHIDPITGNTASSGVAALIGGRIHHFESDQIIDHVENTLATADRQADQAKTHTLHHGFAWLAAEGGSYDSNQATVSATPFLNNQIDVLFIRVGFTDINPAVATKAELESALATTHSTIQNYSYGAASITGTVSSTIYSLGTSTTYSGNANGSANLLTAARNAASAHYVLSNYDVVAVYFPTLNGADFGYAGLASVGGGDHWINGLTNTSTLVSVMVHEFGHNYGLYHANYWDPARQIAGDYHDDTASSLEYGDIFDRMGSGSNVTSGYFNPFATNRLDWLPSGKTLQPTDNGTFRIFRFDSPTALNNPLLALRVPMGGSEYWWVGLRKQYPSIATSAYVVAEGLYPSHSNLIDMTPGSQSPETNDRADAPLPVGGSYYSATHGVRFRTLASGGSAPNEWIDVQIEFDSRLQFAKTSLQFDESAGSAVLSLSRSNGSAGVASIHYSTANGTATAGSDYLTTSGIVTWQDGDASDKQILIPIRPDSIADGGETFTVSLSNPSGAALVSSQSVATVTLRDAGQRLTDFTSSFFNSTVNAIVPLDSGKVIIGGVFSAGFSGNITRLNADGTEDLAFAKGTGFNGEVQCIIQLGDGSLIVGGEFTSYNSVACNHLAKLSANGTLDTTFTSNTAGGANGGVNCVAIENNGRILVGGGFSSFAGSGSNGLVRIQSNGLPDTTSPIAPEYAPGALVQAMIAEPDGKVMVTGSFYVGYTPTGFRSGVIRLHPNGARDTSFDPDAGLHSAGQTNMISPGYAIVRQSDGKYIIGGFFSAYDENPVPNIVRVHANGSYDSSFVPPSFNGPVYSLLFQPGGGIVLAGSFTSPVSRLERLLPGGGTDTTFHQGSGPGGSTYVVREGPDGAIWVGGNFYQYNASSVWPVVKIAGGVSPYQRWAASQFTSTQYLAGTTDPTDDPDNDGINNLAEMAIGTSPLSPGPNAFGAIAGSTTFASIGPSMYLQSSFARSATQPGAWIAAQFSNDLGSWLPTNPLPGNNTIYDIIEQSSTRLTVRDKTPISPALPGRFMRFVVVPPQ